MQLHISIEGLPGAAVRVNVDRALDPADLGILRSLEHRIGTVDEQISRARADLTSIAEARGDAERGLGTPFKHRDALHAARERLEGIDQALTSQAEPNRARRHPQRQPRTSARTPAPDHRSTPAPACADRPAPHKGRRRGPACGALLLNSCNARSTGSGREDRSVEDRSSLPDRSRAATNLRLHAGLRG